MGLEEEWIWRYSNRERCRKLGEGYRTYSTSQRTEVCKVPVGCVVNDRLQPVGFTSPFVRVTYIWGMVVVSVVFISSIFGVVEGVSSIFGVLEGTE